MNNSLIANANNKRNLAYEIIKDTSTEEILSKLGKVEVIGSLRLDLMYRNDIDIIVISEKIENTNAVEITLELMVSKKYRTVGFADYQNFPEYDMPLGYYWELIVIKNNEQWKFDVWYLKPGERYTHMVMDCIRSFEKELSLHPEKRELILEIKDLYFDGVKYKDKVKSIDIYKAVLDNNIDSVEAFSTLIRK